MIPRRTGGILETLTGIAGGLGNVLRAGDVVPIGAPGQHGGGRAGIGVVLRALVQQLEQRDRKWWGLF